MNGNIYVLDCTLRDGGRIIDCQFEDQDILDISERLSKSGIDFVEVGFLRDWHNVEYKGNSTFFTSVEQIRPFVNKEANPRTQYVAFVDYGMFDFESLEEYDGTSIEGIRVGFTKKNYYAAKEDITRCLNIVKEKGYKLFVQGVNSIGYTDKELLDIIDWVNTIKPYGFGIVDTYGAMYVEDIRHIFGLVDKNLDEEICIDFHSHNNFQLSFSLAQEVISLSNGVRNIIIDSTLYGMGKCAGNLNTELIVDYLVRKKGKIYDTDEILDIIDDHMSAIKEKCEWGYSIPSVMAGIYRSHPNNVIYLTEKFRLATKDIKHILSMIDPETRQRYDYDNIKELYQKYNHTKVDDTEDLEKILEILQGRKLLLLLPGKSIVQYSEKIKEYIQKNNAFVISVNFVTDLVERENRMAFFGSTKRYNKFKDMRKNERIIVVSNVDQYAESDYVVNYESLIERDNEEFDNTMIMLLNLLRRLNINKMAVAGFDGYTQSEEGHYFNTVFEEKRFEEKYDQITINMRKMLKQYAKGLESLRDIHFLTPSQYSDILNRRYHEKKYKDTGNGC